MSNVTRKIVADSSADLLTMENFPFAAAPLKIMTAQKEYVDDADLDVPGMVMDLLEYDGRSSTSCPNVDEYLAAFGDAEEVFCITITATLSGSYNAAVLAKEAYEEQHPGRRVFVLNSLTTGPEMALVMDKIVEWTKEGLDFDATVAAIEHYVKHTGLLFMLESMKNLANNGRVSPMAARIASIVGIRVVGKASDQGDLEVLKKCRGEKKALEFIAERMRELGYKGGRVKIAHCLNENAGLSLKNRLQKEFHTIKVELYKCGGLCSFYAEKGGLLIGFEKG